MVTTLADIQALLRRARDPAEIFGPLGADAVATLRRRYRELAALAHPDRHAALAAEAHEAFTALQQWYRRASDALADGVYDAAPALSIESPLRRYTSTAAPIAGDLCDVYFARGDGEPMVLKIGRSSRTTDLLAAEASALRQIGRALAGQPVAAHFPTLVEAFVLRDSGGVRRQINVLGRECDTVSLAQVIAAYPRGIAAADAGWVINRLLTALAVTHAQGLVHGAVLPEHVLIRTADHNATLIDWCYSAPIGAPLRAISRRYAADYPPEVHARQPATPATDLALMARCIARLLGGDGDPERLPRAVPAALRTLLRTCIIPSPHRRPQDAWQLFDDIQQILRANYGPPVFRPFPFVQSI